MTDVSHVTWIDPCDMGDEASLRSTLGVTKLLAGLLTLLIMQSFVIPAG